MMWMLLAVGVVLLGLEVVAVVRHVRRLTRERSAAADAMSGRLSALRSALGRRTSGSGPR